MKQYIYYNSDFIESFLAQFSDGLLTTTSLVEERGEIDNIGTSNEVSDDKGTFGFNAGIFNAGLESGDNVVSNLETSLMESQPRARIEPPARRV